jgi:CheY-like chemotaxis protein
MMTSAGVRGDAQRLNQIGFSGYFGKPIPAEDLHDILEAVMMTRGMNETERQRSGLVTKYTLSEIRRKHSRLLLVEDSPVNREITVKMLAKLGFETDVAASGHAAIEAARKHAYGLILMDMHLPDISGIEAIEAIYGLSAVHAKASFIVLTAGATEADMARCRSLGVKDFLIKPVDSNTLAVSLSRWLSISQSSPAALNATPSTSSGWTTEENVINADPKLVEIFIRETTQRLKSLRQALASSNAQRVAREAHTIKSSSAYFRAHEMHDAAEKLEKMADDGRLDQTETIIEMLEDAYASLRSRLEKEAI